MGKKRKKDRKPYCWYCEREFQDETILVNHQKAKHFKCMVDRCFKKMNSINGLVMHMQLVHKAKMEKVPNAKEGRDSVHINVYGMDGVYDAEENLKRLRGEPLTADTRTDQYRPIVQQQQNQLPYGYPPQQAVHAGMGYPNVMMPMNMGGMPGMPGFPFPYNPQVPMMNVNANAMQQQYGYQQQFLQQQQQHQQQHPNTQPPQLPQVLHPAQPVHPAQPPPAPQVPQAPQPTQAPQPPQGQGIPSVEVQDQDGRGHTHVQNGDDAVIGEGEGDVVNTNVKQESALEGQEAAVAVVKVNVREQEKQKSQIDEPLPFHQLAGASEADVIVYNDNEFSVEEHRAMNEFKKSLRQVE